MNRDERKNPTPASEPPLTPAVLHILLALADGEKHGYAIMQEVREDTDGAIRLGPGTLYGSLDRLERAGFVEESDARPAAKNDDERRRYYRLAPPGRRVLRAEIARLQQSVAIARRKKVLLPAS
jgi:DNA-binding PadR family transcriptional regulator